MTGNTFPLRCHCPTIVPAMSLAEALETTRIHSVAGLTGDRPAWVIASPAAGSIYAECSGSNMSLSE
jgi:predicted ATPase with chaperone activity